jgi:hypothetical protein
VQFGQRVAAVGMSVAQNGHCLIGGSPSGSGFLSRAVIAFTGFTTKKKMAAAISTKLMSWFRKTP